MTTTQAVYLSAAGEVSFGDEQPDAPVAVVADFAEETYVPVQLPPAGRRDRAALLARQLQQEFADTPLRLALPLRPGNPSSYSHVLVALPAARLQHWREQCAGARELVGIWSVALAASWWLAQARCREPLALVVVRTPAGMRHVLLWHGRPVLSRLVLEDIGGDTAVDHAQELDRTLQYLRNARWLSGAENLAAFSWGEPLGVRLREAGGGRLRWLATPTLKGLPDPAEHGLAALLALLRRRRPRTQFAPADWLREHRARRVTYWVAGASALACALLAGLALQQLANAQAAREQLLSLATEKAQVHAESERLRQRLAAAGIDAVTLQAALQAHAELAPAGQPLPALRAVSAALGEAPSLRLDELRWRAAAAAGSDAEGCAEGSERHQAELVLRGETREVAWRQVAADRERFEQRLRAARGVTLHAVRAPLSLQAGPLRAGGDSPRQLPFSYCLRVSEES